MQPGKKLERDWTPPEANIGKGLEVYWAKEKGLDLIESSPEF